MMEIAALVKPREREHEAAPKMSGVQEGTQEAGKKRKNSGGRNPADGKTEKVWMTLPHSPLYGPRLMLPGLAHEPENEGGVIHLFGMIGYRLGFMVLRIQSAFPDCEALRRVRNGRWQRVRIEFEYESRNFIRHRHSVKGCDMIVCWRNNWKGCPVEVLELKEALSNWQSANRKSNNR